MIQCSQQAVEFVIQMWRKTMLPRK